MAYQYFSVKNYIRLGFLLILIAVMIVDFFLDDEFLKHSADLTVTIQKDAGQWLKTVAGIFSGVLTYWFPVFLGGYILFNRDITYMVYIVTLYLVPYTIVFILKAIYYKGRPFVINREVEGCACDPGMPSGHAIMSMITYYIVYRFISDTYWLNSRYRTVFRTILAIFCTFMALAISFSRVVLGAHSYVQLIFAILVGLNVILYLTYQNFKVLIRFIRGRFRSAAILYFLFLTIFTPLMIYINQEYRNDYDFWRYWGKCPRCLRSFVVGQSQSLAIGYFLPAFYFFFPIKYVIKDEDLDLPDPIEQLSETKNGVSPLLFRMLIYITILLPAVAIIVLYQLLLKKELDTMRPIPHALIVWGIYGFIAFYVGLAVGGLKTWIFHWCDLVNNNDYIDIKYLINEYRQSATGRPMLPYAGQQRRHYMEEADIFGRTSAVDDRILRKNQDLLDDILGGKNKPAVVFETPLPT